MKCLKCGYENPNDVQYCLQCGNPLTSQAVNPLGNNVLSQSVTNTSTQNTNSGNPSQDLEKTMIFPTNPTPTNPVVSEPKVETPSTNKNIPDMMNAFEPMNDFPQETQVKVDHSQVNEQVTQSTIPNSVENISINSSKPVENVVPPVVSPTNPVENAMVVPEKPAEPVFGVEKNKVQSTEPVTLNDHQLQQLTLDFVGKNGAKVLSKNINWSAFLFGPLYFFYRRMILFGILLMIIEGLANSFALKILGNSSSFFIAIVIYVLVGLIVGSLFKNIYMIHTKKKINKVLAYNPNESFENIRVQVARLGGTSISNVLSVFGLAMASLVILLPFVATKGIVDFLSENVTITTNNQNQISEYDNF